MSPDQWLEKYFLREIFSGNFDHLNPLVTQLGLTPKAKVVTIAGTNGKGETARWIEFFLCKYGVKTALMTSPHLEKVNERFKFSGVEVSDDELVTCFENLFSKLGQRVSYFEFLFLAFLELSKANSPEVIILEVGLGGRLDAVNSVDADFAALTSISRDHQELLGNSYKKIFFEKAGILRPKQKVFSSFKLEFLNQLLSKKSDELGCQWFPIKVDGLNFSDSNQSLARVLVENLLGHKLPLELGIEKVDFAKRNTWQVGDSIFDLYPSHNPEGIRKLFQLLRATQYNNVVISFSKRPTRDLDSMLRTLSLMFEPSQIYFYEYDHPKALEKEKRKELKDKFEFQTLSQNTFSQKNISGRVLVTGSNYFLGHFLTHHRGS